MVEKEFRNRLLCISISLSLSFFFPGTNAIILNTKTREKRARPFPLNQRLEAGIADEGWFHDILSDSSFSIPGSTIPHHGYVVSDLQAHWQFIKLQIASCSPIFL